MESQRQELRHRDGVQIGRVPPQPPGHDQPVQPCAHRKADGRPAGRGDAGQVREAGHSHQQPAGHIAGFGAHGRDQRAHLAAAKVEVGVRTKNPQNDNKTPGSCTVPGVLFYGEMIMMKEKRTV